MTLAQYIDHLAEALERGHWENAETWLRLAMSRMRLEAEH